MGTPEGAAAGCFVESAGSPHSTDVLTCSHAQLLMPSFHCGAFTPGAFNPGAFSPGAFTSCRAAPQPPNYGSGGCRQLQAASLSKEDVTNVSWMVAQFGRDESGGSVVQQLRGLYGGWWKRSGKAALLQPRADDPRLAWQVFRLLQVGGPGCGAGVGGCYRPCCCCCCCCGCRLLLLPPKYLLLPPKSRIGVKFANPSPLAIAA